MAINVRHRWFRIAAAGMLLVSVAMFSGWIWVGRYLTVAKQAIEDGDWKRARESALIYLGFHSHDATARILMAQALIRDNKLRGDGKIYEALEHLNRIPDTSAHAAEARLAEGRLHLLLLLQPAEAEQCLRRSLQQDPKRLETHSLLWKLFDLTSRWDLAEEHFWQIYEQTPTAERATPLRNWYLSEFSPGAANIELDRNLGFLNKGDQPSSETDRRRLEAFVAADPQWAEGYAILARWFHRQGSLQQAQVVLKQADRLPGTAEIADICALKVLINIELGEFAQARLDFGHWPKPHEGYEYWKAAGLVADQVLQDNKLACTAYRQAIATTPGKSDWLTQHRLAQCLMRSGEAEAAALVRQHSKQVELLMESAVHVRLRRALLTPLDPQTISQMVDLYQQLGRLREVSAWQQLGGAAEHQSPSVTVTAKSALINEAAAAASASIESHRFVR